MPTSFGPVIVALLAVAAAFFLFRAYVRLRGQYHAALRLIPERKTAQQQQDERLDRQLEAVTRAQVTFTKSRVMGGGEYQLFRAALTVTGQPFPSGRYPFYVFPQVALGQIIRTHALLDWQADQAHRAINSKRCDLLIADRTGNPIAVLEYQGAGHNIGGTAGRRDEIKRIALERAGVRYVEINDGAAADEIREIIRNLLAAYAGAAQPPATGRPTPTAARR